MPHSMEVQINTEELALALNPHTGLRICASVEERGGQMCISTAAPLFKTSKSTALLVGVRGGRLGPGSRSSKRRVVP